MKALIVCTNVFPIPLTGYGGIEMLCYQLVEGLAAKGHQVSIVCPEGSKFTQQLEPIFCPVNEDEEATWNRYRARLEQSEWDVILDSSWVKWSNMTSRSKDPQLPIINWHHTSPSVYMSPIPVLYNRWVGLSKSHAENLMIHFQMPVKYVFNGVDTEFYRNLNRQRGDKYLWMARYTVEKGPLEIIELAQKLRVIVDLYGDIQIIGDNRYKDMCFQRADGYFARANVGISRELTVEMYNTHKGLLQWYNWAEPFGLNVVEAMSSGCVPIVARRGDMPELIKNGETGFIVNTIEEMGDLIKKDAVREINLDKMRQHVVDNFSITKFVDSWEKMLLSVAVNGDKW